MALKHSYLMVDTFDDTHFRCWKEMCCQVLVQQRQEQPVECKGIKSVDTIQDAWLRLDTLAKVNVRILMTNDVYIGLCMMWSPMSIMYDNEFMSNNISSVVETICGSGGFHSCTCRDMVCLHCGHRGILDCVSGVCNRSGSVMICTPQIL